MAPILPFLTDSDEQLEATVAAVATSRRALRLADRAAPATRRPRVVAGLAAPRAPRPAPPLRDLYGDRSYAPNGYQREITEKVRALADRYGVGRTNVLRRRTGHERAKRARPQPPTVEQPRDAVQLELI